MKEDQANDIYSKLTLLCGALEEGRAEFVGVYTQDDPPKEWLFKSKLGAPGKFQLKHGAWHAGMALGVIKDKDE